MTEALHDAREAAAHLEKTTDKAVIANQCIKEKFGDIEEGLPSKRG